MDLGSQKNLTLVIKIGICVFRQEKVSKQDYPAKWSQEKDDQVI